MNSISVVIVNWNAGLQLQECVNSVIQNGISVINKIIVVDNGSTDDSVQFIHNLPNVTLIEAGMNLGFGKACNLGAAHADSEFLLFLNPDACIFPNTLPAVLNFMTLPKNINVGICGVQLVDEFGHVARCCSRFPSVKGIFSRVVGLDSVLPGQGPFMFEWDHATTRQVDQVMGAFFLVRRSLFDVLGGFDERFFVYFEEVDFSLRAKQHGFDSIYFAGAKAFHAGGGTSRQVKAKRLFYSLRSRILYASKHFNPLAILAVLSMTLIMEPLSRSVLAVARLSLASLKETWLAYAQLYRWLPEWITKGPSV